MLSTAASTVAVAGHRWAVVDAMDGWDVVVVACQAGMTVSLDDWVVEAYKASDRVGRAPKLRWLTAPWLPWTTTVPP